MIGGHTVKVGDRISVATPGVRYNGVVDMATDEGNYVRIQWTHVKRPDILSRNSPLWRLMEPHK
jgi:hypothetical protein